MAPPRKRIIVANELKDKHTFLFLMNELIKEVCGTPDEFLDGNAPMHKTLFSIQADGITAQKVVKVKKNIKRIRVILDLLEYKFKSETLNSKLGYYDDLE